MGIIRRSAMGTLAVGTRSRSVAAETRIDATTASVDELSSGERAAGILFKGTSHDEGHNAHVTLYADRIERVQEDSSLSIPRAADEVELTPMSFVSSVETKKEGFSYTRASVYTTGSPVDFKFRNKAAGLFRDMVDDLILAKGRTIQAAPAKEVPALSA